MDPLGIIISFPRPHATAARVSIRRTIVARCASTCNWTEGGHSAIGAGDSWRRLTDILFVVGKTRSCLPSPSHHHYISGINIINHSQSWVVNMTLLYDSQSFTISSFIHRHIAKDLMVNINHHLLASRGGCVWKWNGILPHCHSSIGNQIVFHFESSMFHVVSLI